ncbi:MAG: DNA polymerase III subunit delta [Clostridia bacterium]|nr:DNA polymerase III subunit delta [Clostridia bacterium]
MEKINADIKANEFKPVYLLYGDEPYLKKQYEDKLIKAVVSDDTMNYSFFDKESVSVKEIISIGDTLPFFAEKRLIVVENSGFFKSSNDELAMYIKNMPDYLIIIFVEEQIDKRNKLYKSVSETGYVSEMNAQPVSVLTKWIKGLFNAENKEITGEAVTCILDRTGASMNLIKQEIEKLVTYVDNRPVIEKHDVEAVCSTQTVSRIFEMISAIGEKNQQKALNLYYDLLTLKEKPMSILFLIVRQFNGILQVSQGLSQGKNNSAMAKEIGIQPFLVGKYASCARKFTPEILYSALKDCAQVEEDVKSGKLIDRIAVEMIIIKYSS